MPIYEYYCSNCNKEVNILFLSFSEAAQDSPTCPECDKNNLERILSQVSLSHKMKEETLPKQTQKNSDLEDPRSLAKEMKKASRNTKADYGDDFREVAARLEKGESPVAIENKMRKRVGEKMGSH